MYLRVVCNIKVAFGIHVHWNGLPSRDEFERGLSILGPLPGPLWDRPFVVERGWGHVLLWRRLWKGNRISGQGQTMSWQSARKEPSLGDQLSQLGTLSSTTSVSALHLFFASPLLGRFNLFLIFITNDLFISFLLSITHTSHSPLFLLAIIQRRSNISKRVSASPSLEERHNSISCPL